MIITYDKWLLVFVFISVFILFINNCLCTLIRNELAKCVLFLLFARSLSLSLSDVYKKMYVYVCIYLSLSHSNIVVANFVSTSHTLLAFFFFWHLYVVRLSVNAKTTKKIQYSYLWFLFDKSLKNVALNQYASTPTLSSSSLLLHSFLLLQIFAKSHSPLSP